MCDLQKKTKKWIAFFAVLTGLMMAFIWGHSLMSREQSSGESLSLLAFLLPLLRGIGISDPDTAHAVVRKLAHFAEFAALGLFVCGFTVNLGRLRGQRLISLPLLMVLSVAVADEFIQLFSGRAPMVQDVVLDFAGGLTGLAFGALCCLLMKKK
jgi:VanZ family protein